MSKSQEQIRYEHMKNTYNWWSKEYKSIGLVLWFISIYCNFNLAEIALVGDGEVYYPGSIKQPLLATFIWDDELHIPVFSFIKNDNSNINTWNENQDIYIKGLRNERN